MKTKKKAPKGTQTTKQKRAQSRSEAIAEGTRLFELAGRPTKAQSIKIYGPRGLQMTWAERAAAGVDAKHFQEALGTTRTPSA
jgi:murein L,D-transpeptidase YcbB/YkuD